MKNYLEKCKAILKNDKPINYVVASAYIFCYVVLDRVSFLHPFSEIGVTPWDPPQGLTLALLVLFGLRYAPVVPVAMLIAEFLVRHILAPWLPVLPTVTSVLINAAGYIGAAWLLLNVLKIHPNLRRQEDVVRLLIVTIVAAFLVACGTAENYVWFNMLSPFDFWSVVLRSWLGDYVGILTLTPVILVFSSKDIQADKGKIPGSMWLLIIEFVVLLAALILTNWFIFGQAPSDELKLFYLLFIPAMWGTVRYGLGGAVAILLLTEVTLKIAFQIHGFPASTVIDFQLLMVALGLTSLVVGTIVSERRQANQALQESRSYLKAILDTAPDAILTLNEQGCIESTNPTVERMFGWSVAELVQMPVRVLLPDLNLESESFLREHQAKRKNGTNFPAEIAIGHSTTNKRHYTIAVARDISRRVEAESLVRQHRAELAHADRVGIVGEMASNILHEESQPLAAIAAYTRTCQMLIEAPKIDINKISQALNKLATQTQRAGNVLERMRDFLHRGDVEMQPTSVISLIEEVAEFAKNDLSEHDVKLKFDIEPGVPEVMADNIHIQQVLLNLVRNAVEALTESKSPQREIWLSVRHRGKRVMFEVRDTGPGIAANIADRLFEPFTSSKNRGMGLGLSICRSIIAAHDGKLCHLREATPGATFTFDLEVA